jgi:hypothetical protein
MLHRRLNSHPEKEEIEKYSRQKEWNMEVRKKLP